MKKIMSAALLVIMLTSLHAQHKPGETYYTSMGGIKAGMNYSNIRLGDNVPSGTEVGNWKFGFVGGLWAAFPLGNKFSIQPELLYSQMGGNLNLPFVTGTGPNSLEFKSDYFSIPLLFKVHLGKNFAIYAGPEFDFRISSNADITRGSTTIERDFKDSIRSTDISIIGGIQIFPKNRLHIDLRYIYGTQDFWNKQPGGYFNQAFQATVGFRLFGKKVTVPIPPPPPPPDTDNDGIADPADKCPTVAGLAKYDGCPIPDTDKDGINDEQDKCPTVAGLAKYNGCPIPDTDGDGINDEEDKCPTVAGLAKYNGCPIPDTDGDGINDEEDRCPNVAGIPENLGCIDLKFFYKRDVADLSAADKASLDKVAEFMKNNPDLGITVEGHTSTLGPTAYNQTLSEKRAGNCVKYLVSKGIDKSRLTSVGFGEQFPIGDNSIEEGRAQSRRVIFRVTK